MPPWPLLSSLPAGLLLDVVGDPEHQRGTEGLADDGANLAEQADDITMVSLEFGVAPEVSASVVMPAVYEALDRALDFVNRELSSRLCPIEAQTRIDFAVQDLFGSACQRALKEDRSSKCRVSYVYSPQESSLTVSVADDGPAFNPMLDPDNGILNIQQGVDSLSYDHVDGWNVMTFTKAW